MIAKRIIAHLMILLIALPPQAVMADMLTQNTLGGAGGAAAGTPADTSAAAANAANAAAAAAQARAAAQDMLTRNTLALDAVQAMQAAARAAAATMNNAGANPNFPGNTLPDVPDGLGVGGLDFNSAIGASSPTTSMQNARTIVEIQQTQQQAMLEWNTFNIGRQTTLRFGYLDASGNPIPDSVSVSDRIAFNRITDPSGNPSQILGNIEARGQVYVINQNGIIFGGASEVNTGSLTASALPINQTLVNNGLLNNPDAEFLFSSPDVPVTATAYGKIGNVTVQAGAKISAPTSSANVGGRVALIGPNVTNNGTISTPDGQTILAAGMEVGYDAHSSDDPSLRGLDVYVGKVGAYGGTATNNGFISSERGSIVITGKNVNQNGFIHSTTSAALNGRVDLLADYNAESNINYNPADPSLGKPFVFPSGLGVSTGIVSTAAGSVIQVLPEYASTLKVVGTELALKSQVNMRGLGVYLGSDSVVFAPGGNVALSAGIWDLLLQQALATSQDFVLAGGQVYMDRGAVVNVAGSTAVAAGVEQYILDIGLRAAELADTPLQRNSSLRGQTVTVDMRESGTRADGTTWYGTPLANLTGYLGVIERTAGQLTVAGGNVAIQAGESVVMQEGASVNVSGGYQEFAAAEISTTRLVDGGRVVDIARADPSVVYDGVYNPVSSTTDARWGTTTTTTGLFGENTRYEAASVMGGNGGSISITAPAMALDGSLRGGTVVGPQQLELAPQTSSLSLTWQAQQVSRVPLVLPSYSPTPPAITIRDGASGLPAAGAFALDLAGLPVALRQERKDNVILSPALTSAQGFASLSVINLDGDITLPAGSTLRTAATGLIKLHGANVTIEGSILAPAGDIDIETWEVSPYTTALITALKPTMPIPPLNPGRGRIRIGSSAILNTVGLILDDRADAPAPFTVPHAVSGGGSTTVGGTIRVQGHTVEVLAGSLLDVSGGLIADASMHYGDAGSISVLAGNDPLITSLGGGTLTLDGVLRGLSGAHGGMLTLQAPTIQVGGAAVHPGTLLLTPEFFSTGGFSSFVMRGLGTDITPGGGALQFAPGVWITGGVSIAPVVTTLLASPGFSGGQSTLFLTSVINPEGYRDTTSLRFEAPGVQSFLDNSQLTVRGDIVMDAGTRILSDALGSVSFTGQTVEALGEIAAPAGTITIHGSARFNENGLPVAGRTTVHLGSSSRLLATGRTLYRFDDFGRRVGTVHAGGSILVEGNLVADSGALLDVSGTAAILDLLPEETGQQISSLSSVTEWIRQAISVPTLVASQGGTITLKGGDFLYTQATLTGRAGGTEARGGILSVESGRFVLPGADIDEKEISLMVAADMSAFTTPVFLPGQPVVGQTLGALAGRGYFGADAFTAGGFDGLSLKGNVQFNGPVSLQSAGYMQIATGGVLASTDLVRLTSSYVALGTPLAAPMRDEELLNPFEVLKSTGLEPSYFSPTFGTGVLEVNAEVIESGFLSLQGIGRASLTARQEMRGSGYLDIAGHLTLTAGQIYPVTASTFTLTAYDYMEGGNARTGSITVQSSGFTPAFPLSGGGRLNLFASTITQGGTLRAPFGTIRLGWDGTGTAPKGLVTNAAVPETTLLTLAAGSTTSVSAIDPASGNGVVIPYGIVKDGTNWIDPTGLDITSTGAPQGSIRATARQVVTEAGSTLDIRGGGELYGYRWVQGNGGSTDILASEGSYAVLPSYGSPFAPFAPFATAGFFVENLGGDAGYVNEALNFGDRVFLKGSSLLAEGFYTLLPARYALLPGALLVTPVAGTPVDAFVKPGGPVQTSGYIFNSLNPTVTNRVFSSFEVAPQRVVKVRAEYEDYQASTFLPAAQARLGLDVTRTPLDGGYALLGAVQAMQLAGNLSATGGLNGRGGRVDISSPLDIIIAAPGAPAQPGKLVLDSALLSGWSAESLVIGGVRDSAGNISVRTTNLTLDNAGSPLRGTDVLLAASQSLTLAADSALVQTGTQSSADALVLGGNGAFVRVSGVTGARTSRSGVTASALPSLTIGADALISGLTVALDSTNATNLDLSARLTSQAIQLNSGRISIQLTNPGALQPNAGLVLGGGLLTALQASSSLSLLSYSSIDFYGTGSFASSGALELHAGEIRGFNQNSSSVDVTATSLLLDNSAGGAVSGAVVPASGSIQFTSDVITLGTGALAVSQFTQARLNSAKGLLVRETGSFSAQADVKVVTPFISAVGNATHGIQAVGALVLERPQTQVTASSAGLGASLTLEGASVNSSTQIVLPSGLVSIRARTGDLVLADQTMTDGSVLGSVVDAGGVAREFFDATRYTDAGQISLTADAGAVVLGSRAVVNLAAASQAGDAGLLQIKSTGGLTFQTVSGFSPSLLGQAGAGGAAGSVEMDFGSLADFASLNERLNAGAFTTRRDFRVRTGNVTVNDTVNAHRFALATDAGSIIINGTLNASGSTGGRIDLIARDGVTLSNGSTLNVHGDDFDSAGKGGAIWIESTGTTGLINLAAGATLDLGVTSKIAGDQSVVGSSAFRGQFSGKVHLRARQNATLNDLLIDPIASTFVDASSIEIEGFRSYDFNQANVILRAGTSAIAGESLNTTTIHNNNTSFMANYNAMFTRLLGGNTSIQSISVLQPGVEIVNSGGSISLGTPTSAALADWNLSTFRYGPNNAAGTLTMRAMGNLEFYNTLSDGFTLATTGPLVERMWMATLSTPNSAVPVNSQSWNYRLTAGADITAASHRAVSTSGTGSLLLGKDAGQAIPTSAGSNSAPGNDALTRLAINPANNTATSGAPTASNLFQVIRTGTGDIDVSAGQDVQLLNQFATIYTAGVSVPSITTVFTANDFVRPLVTPSATTTPQQGTALGAIQQLYAAQYSLAGGNVSISAGRDVAHYTIDTAGNLIADSSRQLPNNWLMRRGYVDSSGQYGVTAVSAGGTRRINDTASSTTWWINFSNFFDGVAALGGGHVSLEAGRDVQNVSAHAPTNARAARGVPSAATLLEMGGGDVTITAGRNVDGGVYYVERGDATIIARNEITTNATRSASLVNLVPVPVIQPEVTWLPTTFFLGRGSLDIRAGGDALIGPVANTMLLPQGLNNKHWYKTYFSTYGADSAVKVTSLGGDITFRQAANLTGSADSMLGIWLQNVLLLGTDLPSSYQPWLRLVETQVSPFSATLASLMPGTLKAAAFAGDITMVGRVTLSPSPTGTLELLASGSISGLAPSGVSSTLVSGQSTNLWSSSSINVSDASPDSIPGMLNPLAYYSTYFDPLVTNNNIAAQNTDSNFLTGIDILLRETGSTTGIYASLQVKQGLHAAGLHAGDTQPVRLSALGGDISGLELFSPKKASILAGRDITDIAFYIQNLLESDLSLVSSGRDLVAYNANSALRTAASSPGNFANPSFELPKNGDIQISGPGTLQVLAGRDLNLGTGANNTDGTGTGINSIGNGRNPSLPFAGADLVLAAGLGGVATGLGSSGLDFTSFLNEFGSSTRHLNELAELLGVPSVNLNDPLLTSEQQKQLALALFYLVLRDAGRDRNDPSSPDVGTYAAGYRAINALVPAPSSGSIFTQARDVRTKSGGDISILAPGGGLQLASTVLGETLAPPGIISESGGNISVFANDDVSIGIARIFTLRGGDISIWSSVGDIAAGSSSKTVQSAPPTRVIIDPQSASVATDLAGLATGGGIGVLATVAGVRPGNVDLIAPVGAVDAGDAGIRATGNLNIAAAVVLNAANIAVGGTSAGAASAPSVATPSLGGLASAAAATAATSNSPAAQQAAKQTQETKQDSQTPSIITVEVLGYGGGEGSSGEDERTRRAGGAE